MIGGDLITYRPDIQVLDATIRDGDLSTISILLTSL